VTVSVITISDRSFRGEYPDRSGPEIVSILREAFPEVRVATEVVPDETEAIVAAFERNRQADFILTTGGTGISSRDVTPEATRGYCERELPGIASRILQRDPHRGAVPGIRRDQREHDHRQLPRRCQGGASLHTSADPGDGARLEHAPRGRALRMMI